LPSTPKACLVSINVGLIREVKWRGKSVKTAIFKDPVAGPAQVYRLNIQGDQQADPRYHGGQDKAVYAYPAEHYDFWREELGLERLPWGSFGENLTTQGLLETDVRIGERLKIGTVELVVTEPRMPCFKLGIRFGRPDVVKRFQKSRRSGFYLSVAKEGRLDAGDAIKRVAGPPGAATVAEIFAAKG
jgi:MOSC domain-containing protein YiiM